MHAPAARVASRETALLDVLALGDELARPSIRPTSWRSARNRRAMTGREAVEMAGGSPWVPCHLARPRPRGTT